MRLSLTINNRSRGVDVAEHHTLLDVLRDELELTGTKECCLVGECGACTVRMNGVIVDSCLVLAAEADGGEIVTVEGLAARHAERPGRVTALQEAFLEHGAVQCGFCTPGMLMAADDLLERVSNPSLAQIQEGLAGNYCRCHCYYEIFDAVAAAAGAGDNTGPSVLVHDVTQLPQPPVDQ